VTITQILLVLLGLAAWDLLKHLYRGAKLWRLHRRAQRWDRFLAWRRARIAGSRITYPTKHLNLEGVSPSQPYLGMDIPQFVNRSNDHGR